MSLAQPPQEYRASPLMSNNPFRNRITTPQTQQKAPPPQPQPQVNRPTSNNPFLDPNEFQKEPSYTAQSVQAKPSNGISDIFASLSVKPKSQSPERVLRPTINHVNGNPDNVPARPFRSPPLSHRPTGSEEERRRYGASVRRGTEMDIFADPADAASIREKISNRRNSESSVRDRPNSLVDSEEGKKNRDRKSRDPRTGKYRPSRKMDVIDKLDVTSIYGAGLFHHDGPFDACNPNRNKRRHRLAPMQAFPKDSANMRIGGGDPHNKQMHYESLHGVGQEAHRDFNEAAVVDDDAEYMRRPQAIRSTSFNPVAAEVIHGQETAGLGSTTFLEGAPASRVAMERKESEVYDAQQQANGAGVSRKKSLAQKLRGVRGTNRVQSPDSEQPPMSPLQTGRSDNGNNPFFKEYERESEKKSGQTSQVEEQSWTGRSRALSSPRLNPSTERQVTNDWTDPPQDSKPSGLLGRMKSLKKTKSRPERREAS